MRETIWGGNLISIAIQCYNTSQFFAKHWERDMQGGFEEKFRASNTIPNSEEVGTMSKT